MFTKPRVSEPQQVANQPQPVPPRPLSPDAASVREQLRKILASPVFANAARMSRFLQLAIGRTLEGRGGELKEYVIGVEVFDRSASFDPRVDPIVRVEARRLRAKLKTYYENLGGQDGVIVALPTGCYAPSFAWRQAPGPAPAAVPMDNSIAVLPFGNLSTEPDSDYFSDGLTEELSHGLTRLEGLRVVAWRSAAQWKDRQQDLREIGRQLNVNSLVVGTVRRSGARLRVIAQLVDAATGQYLWSETYERQVEDLFAIQEEISSSIVRSLKLRLAAQPEAPAVHGTRNIETYDLYLRGRFHWNKRTAEGMDKAIQLFEQVIRLDPEYAPAHAGLADSLVLRVDYGMGPAPPPEIMPRARAAALRAIELNPTLAEAHTSLGSITGLYEWHWNEAERHYRRAIELNPGYVTGRHWYACDYLVLLGRFDEAFCEMDIAMRLDPLSSAINASVAYLLVIARRYDEALEKQLELQELDPFYYNCYTGMGRIYIQKGLYGQAVEMLSKGRALGGEIPFILGALGQAYALDGREAEARALIAKLEAMGKERYVSTCSIALIYCGLGEKDRALDWLETACRRSELRLTSIGVHPAYDTLRDEPRFRALLKKVGLA
jgi:TolB-like protein